MNWIHTKHLIFFIVVCILITTGCVSQNQTRNTSGIVPSSNPVVIEENGVSLVVQAARDKAALAANKTQQPLNVVPTIPLPAPDPGDRTLTASQSKSMSRIDHEMGIGNFTKQLGFYNKVMNWGLSQTQIEDYANTMENGILKKYITNPQYPVTLDIPNGRQFYLEIGEDLGFTKEESEEFVRAIDEYQRKEFEITDCPSWGNCSASEPIVINFSVKPRLHTSVNAKNPTITSIPAPSHVSVSPGVTNSYFQNLTEMTSTDLSLRGIVMTWDDLLKKWSTLMMTSTRV